MPAPVLMSVATAYGSTPYADGSPVLLSISGTSFGNNPGQWAVTLGGYACSVISMTETNMMVQALAPFSITPVTRTITANYNGIIAGGPFLSVTFGKCTCEQSHTAQMVVAPRGDE